LIRHENTRQRARIMAFVNLSFLYKLSATARAFQNSSSNFSLGNNTLALHGTVLKAVASDSTIIGHLTYAAKRRKVVLSNVKKTLRRASGEFLSPSNQRKEQGHVHTRS
jgi:hypothetical protein